MGLQYSVISPIFAILQRKMKKSRYLYSIGIASAFLLSLIGCYSPTRVSNQNIAEQYKNDIHSLHPEFNLVHVDDSMSLLYFKINESELLYERRALSDSFSAAVRVSFRVTINYESPLIMDSNSTVIHLQSLSNSRQEYAVGSMPVKLSKGTRYLLTALTLDMNSKRNETTYITANKTDFSTGQNFLVRDPDNGHIIFSPIIDSAMHVSIQYMQPAQKLYVKIYKNKFPIAAPPFNSDEYSSPQLYADSSFSITKRNGMFQLYVKSRGMYHITADSNDMSGLTLFRFDESYPNISQAYQLVAPLRYISSNEEFGKLVNSKAPKEDVDNFWLTAASGNKDRGRALVHNYYSRIQEANRYFASYEEGWRTDRGMIYLIFGPPSSIYRSSEGETWSYGEERSYMALSFTFIKLDNPFSDNDYALQRNINYRNIWYNAVDLWRDGRIY